MRPQTQYGSHMIRRTASESRARWCLVPTKASMAKCIYLELTIRAYPKNVNLPVLGQGNLPLNRLKLLSSKERRRKKEKDIWNQQLCGLYPRAADSVTPLPLWHGTATLHENPYTLFPSFTLILPVISPPFSNRLGFLIRCICAPDMWKVG